MSDDTIRVTAQSLMALIETVFLKEKVRPDAAHYVAEGLVQTSLRAVDSHGVRLFPHYLRGVKGGRINRDPQYRFDKTSPSTGKLDADHTFGHAAGMEAAKRAVELAAQGGAGFITVYNSTHFGAAAYFALEVARHDMIGMSFTNTDALVKSHGGKRAFLGNNPICFTAPCDGEEPFCLDMATSIVTFNKIRQFREKGMAAPKGVGADKDGIETTDAEKIHILMPVGEHKGYGLSMMVEILCSILSGMPFGPHIPKMFEAPMSEKRYLGQFVAAINISCFLDVGDFKKRLSGMMNELRNEPPTDAATPVQVSGDTEKKAALIRGRDGIPMEAADFNTFKKIAQEYAVEFNSLGGN